MLAQLDPISPALSAPQKERLRELERTIEHSLTSFLECGRALLSVRDERLYTEHFRSFEDYCVRRCGLTGHRGRELIRSTLVAETLLRDAEDVPLPPDTTESMLRPLSRFSNPELQQNTWRLINSLGTKPTASTVAKVSRSIRQAIRSAYDCNGRQPPVRPLPPAHELIFLRPITKLAANDDFNPEIVCLSIDTQERAWKFARACREISRRCETIIEQLRKQFPGLSECRQPEPVTEAIE
jgi:hypothetical protein